MTDETLMPFGKKYKNKLLREIPLSYINWMANSIQEAKSRLHMSLSEKKFLKYREDRAKREIQNVGVSVEVKEGYLPIPEPEVYKPKWLEIDALKKLGYDLISGSGGYYKFASDGKTVETAGELPNSFVPKGKRILYFNTTYAPKDKCVAFGVREDGDTRNAFNGVVYTLTELKTILKLVR
jgi:hypothetical protein